MPRALRAADYCFVRVEALKSASVVGVHVRQNFVEPNGNTEGRPSGTRGINRKVSTMQTQQGEPGLLKTGDVNVFIEGVLLTLRHFGWSFTLVAIRAHARDVTREKT